MSDDDSPEQSASALTWAFRGLLLAGLILWIAPWLPLWTPMRLAIAGVALLVLPGAEIARRFGRHVSMVDVVVAGFGIQLVLVSILTVIVFQAGWHARGASAVVLLGALAASAWPARHAVGRIQPRWRPGFHAAATIFALLLALATVCLYVAGVPFDGLYGEDFLAIGYIRKLASLASIQPDNYMYKTPATLAYVYAPFHFWEAMIVSLSGLDPIVVYHRIRTLWFVISILVHVALIRSLTGSLRSATLGGIVLVLLMASTFGGVLYAWGLGIESGQLAPLSHPADFAIGILAPLAITLAVALVLTEDDSWRRLLTWVAPVVPCAVFMIHPREVLQYLLYVGLLGVAFVLSGQLTRQRMSRLAALVGVPLLFALIVGRTVMQTPEVVVFEQGAMRQWHERYGHVLSSLSTALFGPPIFDPGGQPTVLRILWALPGYALFVWIAPIGLAFRRSVVAIWFALACVAFVTLIRVPALSYLFVSATYSQALFSGEVYLYPAVYTFIALVIALASERAVARWGAAGVAAAAALGVALAAIATLAMTVGSSSLALLVGGVAVAAAVGLIAGGILDKQRPRPQLQQASGHDAWVIAATVAATLPLMLVGMGFRGHLLNERNQIEGRVYKDERPTLPEFAYNQYQSTWLPATDWTRRFDRTFGPDQFTIPSPIMHALRALPGPAVVDGPFESGGLIEVHLFTPHYLVHTGTAYMLDRAYRAQYIDSDESHPIFSASEDFAAERARAYLASHGVRYLVLDPPHAFVSRQLGSSVRPLVTDAASGWSMVEVVAGR